jgi:hypothetical protein
MIIPTERNDTKRQRKKNIAEIRKMYASWNTTQVNGGQNKHSSNDAMQKHNKG